MDITATTQVNLFWKGVEVSVIFLVAGLASIFIHFFLRSFRNREWIQKSVWWRALLEVVSKPLQWVIWLTAGLLCFESLMEVLTIENWETVSRKVRHGSAVIIITWLTWRWKKQAESIILSKRRPKNSMDKATIFAISRLLNAFILAISGLTLLRVIGVPISSFLALGGVGAIAFTYSSSDVVKNFFGGLMIQTTRPFAVGDWINSPDKQIEGTVEHIGWYMTVIRKFDKRPIYVPNGLFPAIIVRNPSRMSNRRILADVGVRYDDVNQVRPIVSAIEQMLREHPAIDQKQTLMVHFTGFGPHSLDLNIYCFTITRDWAQWRSEQQDVLLKVAEIIESHGAEIAFPTQVVKVEQEPSPIES